MYNLVGFQTKLAYPEQERVFSLIPGLGGARFLRYGSVHRNTFLDSPRNLHASMECRNRRGLFFAGQITGVEGYSESIASGFVAAGAAAARGAGEEAVRGAVRSHPPPPRGGPSQPMNANFGLLPLPAGVRKRERKTLQADRALSSIGEFRRRFFDFDPSCVT